MTVTELVNRYKDATRQVAASSKGAVEKQVGAITCRPKCSYCCYQKILAPTFVGAFIYLYLRRQNMWSTDLRAKLAAADRDMTARTHRGWLMNRRPCPFLEEESFGRGSCTIYPVRPEVCAITYSVAGDGRKCAVPGEKSLVSAIGNADVVPFIPLALAAEGLGRGNMTSRLTTLPAAVLLAEAALERLPAPTVAGIPAPGPRDAPGRNLEEEFDALATVPDGE